MRRLLWPLRSPTRRAVLVAVAFALLLAWLVPYQPRWSRKQVNGGILGFSPDGRRLAAIGSPGPAAWEADAGREVVIGVIVYDAATGEAGPVLDDPQLNTLAARLGPSTRWLLWEQVRDPSSLWVRQVKPVAGGVGELNPSLEDLRRVHVFGASPDHKYWFHGAEDKAVGRFHGGDLPAVQVREIATGRPVVTTPAGVTAAAFGPEPGELTALHFTDSDPAFRVRRWNLASGALLSEAAIPPMPLRNPWPASVLLVGNGRSVLRSDGRLCELCDAADGHVVRRDDMGNNDRATFQPHEGGLASATGGGNRGPAWLRVWATAADTPLAMTAREGHHLWLAAASPAGATLAVADEPDVTSLAQWAWLNDWLRGTGLQVGPRTELRLTDARTGATTAVIGCGPGAISAAFSGDGRQLAVTSDRDSLRVYDLPLRRPWAVILGGAFAAALAFAAFDAGVRRWRRRGRSASSASGAASARR